MNTHLLIWTQRKQMRKPPRAVERRDKRGKEEYSEADPAQSENNEDSDQHYFVRSCRNGCRDCFSDCYINLLQDGRTITMKEVRR